MSCMIICDRCGEKVEEHMPKIKLLTNRRVLRIETSMFSTEYDLCESCWNKLNRFLVGKNDVVKENKNG